MIDFDATVLQACTGAFGEQILFQPACGLPAIVPGIFNERATDTKFEEGTEVVEEQPRLGCRASDFGTTPPVVNDVFVIRGRLWRVADVTPDGEGHLRLRMMFLDDSQAQMPELPPTPLVVAL